MGGLTQSGIDEDVLQLVVDAVSIPTDIEGNGSLTVGTSEVEITFTGTTKSIRLKADDSNAGIIYIGKTGVLSDGTNDVALLRAGDEMTFDYDDTTNALYAIADTAAQTLRVGALL